jgi:uncharacterized protein (TIGR03437 family)
LKVRRIQKTLYCLIAGVCFYVSAASAQIGAITNVGKTVNNMDAIAFNSAGVLYGGTSGAGSLYTVNPSTGAVTLVHALVGASNPSLTYGVKGLAFQPGTGALYAATSPDSPNSGNSLVTINPATGQVTVIGPSGTGYPYTNISFAPNGTLYGWLVSSASPPTISAATINLGTGAGTSLGSPQTPSGLPDGGGLAVNASGVIYVAANGHAGAPCSPNANCSGALWTINPANGAPTTIGTLTGGPGSAPTITALAFAPSGALYGIEGGDGGASWNLITISVPPSPGITGVENAASNIVPGLPNAGIAQGSIFIVQGNDLGPANISIASSAFQSTTLSDTSVAVTVGGTTVNALMYYTSAGQVAALLPSNTPTGTGTVTVSYTGETSFPIPITVVPNNLGIFSIDSSGSGPGIVTYADYSLVSAAKIAGCGGPNTACGAANPGDTLILWATGLGPVNGSDAAGAGLGVAIDVPLTLWLGGVPAPVVYQGRSGCCVGEDQIVFTVPDNVPTGCAVPLLVQIGSEISNNVVMPVANGTRDCTPTNPAIPASIEQEIVAGPIAVGTIKLDHYSDGNGAFEDDGKAQFQNFLTYAAGSQPFFLSWVDSPPPGACLVYNNSGENTNGPPVTSVAKLDAGSTITLMGPNGNVALPENQGLNEFDPGNFLVPGVYTVTGTGGANVGSFSGTLTIPASPTLTSPVNGATVTRSSGLTVTWTGGGSGNVAIDIGSCTDSTCASGATALCVAPASAGTFTIPPYVLLAFPAGGNGAFVLSTQAQASFSATGLDFGLISLDRYNVAGFGFGWGSGSLTFK